MPDRKPAGATALLIIDMINRMDFHHGDALRQGAERIADRIEQLRDEATAAQVPVIYVNDNHGDWLADERAVLELAQQEGCPGRDIALRLAPRACDYFVMKPQFSGFYSTTLPAILPRLGVRRLIITGVAADICVLFTAADAHMREYELWVPADAVASEDDQRTRWALDIMAKSMKADIRPTTEQRFAEWLEQAD